jgi:hypothetical protein
MRPTKEEYDRYIALVEFGRSLGWNARDIGQRNPFFVADPGTTFILLAADRALLRMAHTAQEDRRHPGHRGMDRPRRGRRQRLWDPSAADLRCA